MLVTAKPWEGKKRRHVYNPPITIGLMTDVSGSMGWAEQTVAATSYVFSKAMTRVSGRFAAVTFGDKAEAMVWPNEILNEVRVRPANGGSEDFDHGVAALDGMLKLTTGKGVRLLVVVSDGQFVRTNEPERANVWYDRLAAAGVGIVWINGYDPRKGGVIPKNAELVQVRSGDVTGMIGPIATAMERAIATQRS
jgi:Mg-chelatase subunit ChlD